jgi:hypothetical protein
MYMKIIITEEQYERIAKSPARLWILRNYPLVEAGLIVIKKCVDPCRFETYEKYEGFFFAVFMDELHPHYYLIDDFDYTGVESELKDMFYVDTTEAFSEGKEKCL